jgi:hypothetical protein
MHKPPTYGRMRHSQLLGDRLLGAAARVKLVGDRAQRLLAIGSGLLGELVRRRHRYNRTPIRGTAIGPNGK